MGHLHLMWNTGMAMGLGVAYINGSLMSRSKIQPRDFVLTCASHSSVPEPWALESLKKCLRSDWINE